MVVLVIVVVFFLLLFLNRGDAEDRKTQPPRIQDFTNHYEYKQAYRKWELSRNNPETVAMSLERRLQWRGHSASKGYYGDNLHYSTCYICGASLGDDETRCSECDTLYERSPKEPLPNGIPESHRYSLWRYRQAIIVDLMKGLISKEDAEYEINVDAVEQVKADMHKTDDYAMRQEAVKRNREQKLQERVSLAERLSTK